MTALYDFGPSQGGGGGELAVKGGQMLLLLDASHIMWWKFKIKTNRQQNDGNSGTVPKMLTEEAKFISTAAACEGFIAQTDGDLTIAQNDDLSVYCIEGDWALVKGAHAAGYVPRACIKLEEEMNQVVALFDFQATEPEHLGFREGEILTVLDRTSKDWWRCENAGHETGMVPVNLVKDASTIVSLLVSHGCKDLSSAINPATFGDLPVAQGGFGDVYRGQLSDGTIVSVKVLRDSFDNPDLSKHLKRAARELHVWSKCSHPNVLPLLGLAVFRGRIGMISPWMGEGTLPAYLERTPGINRYDLCRQICEGLSYLHGIGIIHGNLKGANIPISNEGMPLLGDFGNSQLVNRSVDFTSTRSGPSFTLRWTAPEVLTETGPPSKSSDVYALGMVCVSLKEFHTGTR
ncbi:hypothetical protein FRC11_009086 [Ceratobasidium sp. 423]|nr:hypothetical protein FRC11_009086 [Ceratobasidium sp. 423]